MFPGQQIKRNNMEERHRLPVECLIEVDNEEITEFYPFLQEVRVDMTRRAAATASIVIDSIRRETGEWTVQDSDVFLPWKELKITAEFGDYSQEILRGYIKEVKVEYPDNMNQAKVTITGQDESLILDRVHVREALSTGEEPVTDGDVARSIAQDNGLDVDAEDGLTNTTLNHTGTPIRLLQQRAEANGFELYVRESTLYFKPPQLEGTPQPTIMVYAGNSTNCYSFSATFDGHKPDNVTVMRAATGTDVQENTVQSDLTLLGTTPATSENMGLEPFTWIMEQPNGATEEEIAARALSSVNENAWKIVSEGQLDGSLYGHVLLTYETVAVDGVGEIYGGLYYVDEVHHNFAMRGYRQQFKLLRNAIGDDTNE